MQRRGRIPGFEADASDPFPNDSGRVKRDTAPVAEDDVASLGHPENAHLKAFERGIHIARGALTGRFLAEDMPGLEGGAQFEIDPAVVDGTELGKTKLEERPQPLALERDAALLQVAADFFDVGPDVVRQHEMIVQRGSPADRVVFERLLPKKKDERTDEQALHQ